MDAAGIVNTAPVSIQPILPKLGVILFWYGRRPCPVDSFEPPCVELKHAEHFENDDDNDNDSNDEVDVSAHRIG